MFYHAKIESKMSILVAARKDLVVQEFDRVEYFVLNEIMTMDHEFDLPEVIREKKNHLRLRSTSNMKFPQSAGSGAKVTEFFLSSLLDFTYQSSELREC